MTDTIAPATAAMSRVKGPVRFQDAAAYNRTLSKEQSDAASRGCHWMSIYVHGYKIPVGVSYNVICCDRCPEERCPAHLWTPFFSWFNPLPFCGLMCAMPRAYTYPGTRGDGGWPIRGEADGGWGDPGGVDDKSNMKVVDVDHGIIVHYQSHYWICGDQVDPNKVLMCWCEKC